MAENIPDGGTQGMDDETLQRLEQRIQGRLEQEIDHRFRRFEERFGEIVDWLDALGVDVNQN